MSRGGRIVVIGAGANGLTTAGLLARAGREVLVLERRESPGGLAAGQEFHPGYRSPGLLHDSTRVAESVVRELDLERHGLQRRGVRPGVLALGRPGGEALWLDGDRGRAAEEISSHSRADAEAWARFHGFFERIRGVLAQFLTGPPVNLVDPESMGVLELVRRALKVRSLGRRDMMEFLRLPPMCVADWMDEWFQTDLLKLLMAWPAVAGSWMGPRSPGSNANLLVHEALAGAGVAGNGPALVDALERAVRSHGAEIRTGAAVRRILMGGTGARGVVLDDGEEIAASVVAASCDPVTLVQDLLPPGAVGARLAGRMRSYRMRGTTGQVLLALDGVPRYGARPGERVEYARTGTSLRDLEQAFDPVKYRRIPSRPAAEFHLPEEGPHAPAPAGSSVVSALVQFLPQEPQGGWTDHLRESLADQVVEMLEAHAPGSRALIVGRKVLAPPDIEREYGVKGGHIHHGEHALDQLLIRPVPEFAGYATPHAGLFLCGMGTHPGGGLTCLPGQLGARAILAAKG